MINPISTKYAPGVMEQFGIEISFVATKVAVPPNMAFAKLYGKDMPVSLIFVGNISIRTTGINA